MIFFALDQVAGAEYLLPFLLEPKNRAASDWKIFAAQAASSALARHAVDFELVSEPSLDYVKELFNISKPSKCVVSTTGESRLERMFVHVAKARGVPCAQLIDNWVNYRQRFLLDGEVLYPDHILTLDDAARGQMIREGIPSDLIRVIGQPYLEFKLGQEKSDGSHSQILLLTQPIDRYYQKSLGYDQWDFLEVCLEAFRLSQRDSGVIEINVHPAEELAVYDRFLKARQSTAIAVKQSDLHYGNYSHFLGMFSSVLLHGVLHGVSTASVQPAAVGPDRCFLSENGIIPRFTDVAGLAEFMQNAVSKPEASRLLQSVLGSEVRLRKFILHEL